MDIKTTDEYTKCMNLALNYITAAMKPERRIRDYLIGKGFSLVCINEVMLKLKDYGYVNDKEYAKLFVEQNAFAKGRRRLADELKNKGINEHFIVEALSELGEQAQAVACVAERFMRNKERTKENLQKLFRHLIYRGFEYETVKSAIKEWENIDEQRSES